MVDRFRESSADCITENFRGHRFAHKVSRAEFHRIDCKLDRGICSRHHHARVLFLTLDLPERLQAVHARHSLVQDHSIPARAITAETQSLSTILRLSHFVTYGFERQPHHAADVLFVINYQYSFAHNSLNMYPQITQIFFV